MKSEEMKSAGAGRVMSIDALRGFDMFWITGGVPLLLALVKVFVDPPPQWLTRQFEHKPWNGFSAEDLIMPLFLFVVGAAMPFSFARRVEQGRSKRSLYLKIARRVVILWVLGMMMQGHLLEYDLDKLVLFSNTLQAIAVGYALTAALMIHCGILWQMLAIPALLVGYWLLMVLVPVPGHGAGVLEPGANLARYIDEVILGRFRYPMNYTWILSGLGFTSTVLLGAMSGHLLRLQRSQAWKVVMLLALGVGSLAIGALWDRWFPINKHMWTSSMVLWAGGWSFLLLAVFYLAIDVAGWRRWAYPFVVIGANAIVAYTIGKFVSFRGISDVFLKHLAPHLGAWGDFVQQLGAMIVMLLAFWYLYRNRTFIRI